VFKKDIKNSAYGLLARREHSKKELRQKLLLRDYALEDIEPILQALSEQNIQSDVRFAESLMRVRISRGYGWIYICAELKQKGLANDIISEIHQTQSIDWFEQAHNTYQKRFADTPISDQKDKAKRIRFLQSRGFDFEQISAVLNLD
jgi:regulatory protein